jgi:capsid protein
MPVPPKFNRTSSVAETFGELRADYGAAQSNRFRRVRTGMAPGGSHADYHYRSEGDYLKIMEYARAMDRDDCLLGHMLDAAVDSTLLHGIDVQPQTGNDELNKALAELWWAWCEQPDECDAAGELTFAQMQRLAFRQSLLDGDIIGILTDEGRVWHFEGHRIRTPQNTTKNVVLGVKLDNRRRRLEYWATNEDLDPQTPLRRVGDITPYAVRDDEGQRILVHCYNPKRMTQTRGVSALAPIFDPAGQFEDIQFAKLVQQQAASCFAIIRLRGDNWDPQIDPTTGEPERTSSRQSLSMAPGMEIKGEKGETISMSSANVPNAEYFPHMKMTLQTISVNLGLPLMLALMDASETNFSGWRGALDAAKNGWRANQERTCVQYVGPIYRWKVRDFLAQSPALRRLAANPETKALDHRYHKPVWPYIQPLQDATTDSLRLREHLTSPQRNHAERNQDAFEILKETITFNRSAIEAAKAAAAELNKQLTNGEPPITWRDLYQISQPDGVNLSISATAEPGNNGGGKPNAA